LKKHPVVIVFLVFVALLVGAVLPAMPRLWAEIELSGWVQHWASQTQVAGVSEGHIRSRVQAMAREKGFHLEFSDIVVQYRDAPEEGLLPVLAEVGYTLPMELSLFGVLPWRVVAVRIYPFRGELGS
jgi:hypothetical protein